MTAAVVTDVEETKAAVIETTWIEKNGFFFGRRRFLIRRP